MITNDQEYSTSIKQAGYFATKFPDAFTEYVHDVGGLRMWFDEWTGDVEGPMGSVALIGKRLMFNDERGFVCIDKYKTETDARRVYDAIDAWYCEWADDEDAPSWFADPDVVLGHDRAKADEVKRREQYVCYVIDTTMAGMVVDDYETWCLS